MDLKMDLSRRNSKRESRGTENSQRRIGRVHPTAKRAFRNQDGISDPPTKRKKGNADLTKTPQQKVHVTSTAAPVRDASEVLSAKKKTERTTKLAFPKIIYTDTTTPGKTTAKPKQNEITKTTQTV